MRPQKRVPKADADMFRARLDQIINPRHELLKLDRVIDDVRDLKVRATSIEAGLVGVHRRLDRIEKRLELTAA